MKFTLKLNSKIMDIIFNKQYIISSFQKIKKIRKNVFKREESIEKLLDGLALLHPTQIGKFVKGLDKVNLFHQIIFNIFK